MRNGSIKAGTQLYGVKPEMVMVDSVVQSVFLRHEFACVRTSVTGKKHGKYSLHPPGYAIDYRTKHIIGPDRLRAIEKIVFSLKEALPCCDIVFEHPNEEQEHIHIEFDPKDDPTFQKDKAIYRETGQWPS